MAILLHLPPHALRLSGLAKKENFSKQNRRIAGNGGVVVCARELCVDWGLSIVVLFYLYGGGMNWLRTP